MPFTTIPAKVRNSPLGPAALNTVRDNLRWLADLFDAEHAPDGSHNSLEVARTFGKMTVSGASYVANNFGTHFTSVATPAAGTATLTLPSGKFFVPGMAPIVTPQDYELDIPVIATVELVSATSLKVHLKRLTSALGAGNAWFPTTVGFDIGIHTLQWASGGLSLDAMARWVQREYLTQDADMWNAFVANAARLRAKSLVQHTSTGNHLAVEIAKEYGSVTYDGGVTYAKATGDTIASVSRSSTGIVDVTTTNTYASTTALMCQVEPQWNSLVVATARSTSATTIRVEFFEYNPTADTWARADASFFIAVYGNL